MTDQDWKTCGLNRKKYQIAKMCTNCSGSGYDIVAPLGMCYDCNGTGYRAVDETAAYFVLRLDCDPDTGEPHDPHARQALVEYADLVSEENVGYATGIVVWLQELKSAEP